MVNRERAKFRATRTAKTTILLTVVFFIVLTSIDVTAQRRFSRTYPATDGVRIVLVNRTGTITVEGWNRNEVSIAASLEAPAANMTPQNLSGVITINLVKDNQGRGDVGMVNFLIRVPVYTLVDIETKVGNLSVSNVRSGLVRAYISSEGDITLTNIGASQVSAENVSGDIFFDGELRSGGSYRFSSTSGNINLRIPFNSSFSLVGTAPSTRNISLGPFMNANMNIVGNGRRVVGRVGDGSATLSITNQRGNIGFLAR